jgi:lysophospholipase
MDDATRRPDQALPNCGYVTSGKGISIRYHRWLMSQRRPIGTIILLGGRKEFLEKYIETANDLNRLGFDVYSFDWRGQGLSTRMFADRTKGFINDYDEYLTDLQVFIDTVIPADTEKPIYFLAHSMGAHIALRYLHRHSTPIGGAILSAPMIDIFTEPYPSWLVRLFIRLALKIKCGHAVLPGSRKRSERELRFEGNPLTSDPERFQFEKIAVAANPDLAVDAVTFAWLSATMKSIDQLNSFGYLEAITTPILIVSAGADRIVSIQAQRKACARLPDCRLTSIPKSRHEILMETNAIREKFWQEFQNFTRIEQPRSKNPAAGLGPAASRY